MRWRSLHVAELVAGVFLALGCATEERPPHTPPPPPPPVPWQLLGVAEAMVKAVAVLDTLDGALEIIQTAAEIGAETRKLEMNPTGLPSPVSARSSSVDSSTLGGIRCADARESVVVPPPPPTLAQLKAGCDADLDQSKTIHCSCLSFVVDRLPLEQPLTCLQRTGPPVDPETRDTPTTVLIRRNEACENFQISLAIFIPGNARLPGELMESCKPADGQLRCSREVTLAEISERGSTDLRFYPLPVGEYAFAGRRFEFPAEAGFPEDLSSGNAARAFLESASKQWEISKDESARCMFFRSFLKKESGWSTRVRIGARDETDTIGFRSYPQEQLLERYGTVLVLPGDTLGSGDGKKPGVFTYSLETWTRKERGCVPVDLYGVPLRNALGGAETTRRFIQLVELAEGPQRFTYGQGASCSSGAYDARYASEALQWTREYPEPAGSSQPERRLVSEAIIRRTYAAPAPPKAKPETECPSFGLTMVSYPGIGEGYRAVVRKYSDGGEEKREMKWLKEEGTWMPAVIGQDGNPVRIGSDEKGDWSFMTRDQEGNDIAYRVKNPFTEKREILVSSGFLTGKLLMNPQDGLGIVGEGMFKIKLPGGEAELAESVGLEGWRNARGKIEILGGKAILFWVERREKGAEFEFRALSGFSENQEVPIRPEDQGGPLVGSGSMLVQSPKDPENLCEKVAEGRAEIFPGAADPPKFSLVVFEDGTELWRTEDGKVIGFAVGCAVGGDQAAGEERPIILSKPRPMSRRIK